MEDLSDSNQQSWFWTSANLRLLFFASIRNILFLISGLSLAGLAHHGSHESLWCR